MNATYSPSHIDVIDVSKSLAAWLAKIKISCYLILASKTQPPAVALL